MRLLFLVQNFRQGWGGAPESARMMARCLAAVGFESDVFDAGLVRRNVETMLLLPEQGTDGEPFPITEVDRYGGVLIVGPWQNPLQIRRILSKRQASQPLYYLPRGGFDRVEFSRFRDLKKIVYFPVLERPILRAAEGVVLSSQAELREMIVGARRAGFEHIIPDLFAPQTVTPGVECGGTFDRNRERDVVTFAWLAEISPRKGLLPLVEAFISWATRRGVRDRVRLVVGGVPRPGSERYLAKVHAAYEQHAHLIRIAFIGAVPHIKRPAFYAAADVVVLSSLFESYGLTLLEALSAGCAVISAPNVGVLEYVPKDESVSVTKGLTAEHFAAAFDRTFDALSQGRASERARTRSFAAKTVCSINSRAVQAWRALLSAERGNGPATNSSSGIAPQSAT